MNVHRLPRRNGLFQINVNQPVELKTTVLGSNNYGKKQFSAIINGQHYFLPTHQQLTDKLEKLPIGSEVVVERLTVGGPKEACEYDVKVIKKGENTQTETIKEDKNSDFLPRSEKNDAILSTIVSCLLNNATAGQTIMVLKQEFSDEDLRKVGL